MDIPILSLLILIPLIGAIATLFMGGERQKYAKYVAGVFSAITLVLSLYIMFATDMGELSESYAWIDTSYIVINFALAVDGLSIWKSDSWESTWRRTTSCSTSCGRSP